MLKIKFTLIILAFVALMVIASCNSDSKQAQAEIDNATTLLHQYCFNCHTNTPRGPKRIAPPFRMVKEHYLSSFPTEDEFVEAMASFVSKPIAEHSLMPGAIKNFGLMPPLGLPEEDLRDIARYIFNADLTKPDWGGTPPNAAQFKDAYGLDYYLKIGRSLAIQTKTVLGQNLMTAIKDGGPEHAVEFCNTRAIHLTDSMAAVLNVDIKRVSDQNRNPDNAANQIELNYILAAKDELKKSKKAAPLVTDYGDYVLAYYPIMTNDMCLKCHGGEQDINAATLEKLNALYPDDKAKGYSSDQLRGIWVVKMQKLK